MDGTAKTTRHIVCKEHSQGNSQQEESRVGHALGWFRRLCPKSFFHTLLGEMEMAERSRVFTLHVTVWLMIIQRLSGNGGTLAAAVSELVNGNGWDVLEPCKRVREHRISTGTGGFSQARMRLPVKAARRVSQHTFDQLYRALRREGELRHRLFLLDGSSVELAHTKG